MNKHAYIVVLESGKLVLWSGKAENSNHAEGLAIAYATQKHNEQVYDIAERPINLFTNRIVKPNQQTII